MSRGVFEHFGAQAGDYARRTSSWPWSGLRQREARAVMTALDPKPGERILDAGCGAGFYTRLIRDAGADVRGVDGSPKMIEAALAAGFEADLFDLAEGPPPGAPHDKILCAGALEFCDDPARVVANLIAGLKGSGAPLVVLVPGRGLMARLYRRHHHRHGLEVHLFSHADLEALTPRGVTLTTVRRVAFSLVARIERTQ